VTAQIGDDLLPVVAWLDDTRLGAVDSARSWNDLSEEQSKEWWIANGTDQEFARLQLYLENTGLMDDYQIAEQYIAKLPEKNLAVADLAAGIGWTSSLISRLANVASVHAVDISRHRLEVLFPQAIRMFKGQGAKIRRHLGSFYELGLEDRSMDVVLLSAAFHHASNPLRLLVEIDRVLKPGGHLVLIGENIIRPLAVARRMIKILLTQRRLCTNFYELFPPDHDWGDHYYRTSDYYLFLQMVGYKLVIFSVQRKQTAAVIAEKNLN
jgi:SAM-dependent methyltransferase